MTGINMDGQDIQDNLCGMRGKNDIGVRVRNSKNFYPDPTNAVTGKITKHMNITDKFKRYSIYSVISVSSVAKI